MVECGTLVSPSDSPGFRHRLMRRTFLYYILVQLTKVIKNIYLYSLYLEITKANRHTQPGARSIEAQYSSRLTLEPPNPAPTVTLDHPFTSPPCPPNPYCNEHRKRLVTAGSARITAELGSLLLSMIQLLPILITASFATMSRNVIIFNLYLYQ